MSCPECGSPFNLSHYGDCRLATRVTAPAKLFRCAVSGGACVQSSPECHRAGRCMSDAAPADVQARQTDACSTQAENELICEKLLRWEPIDDFGDRRWRRENGGIFRTPSFTTWHDCGLILEALLDQRCAVEVCTAKFPGGEMRSGVQITPYDPRTQKTLTTYGLPLSGPLAVRAAALSYLRSLER